MANVGFTTGSLYCSDISFDKRVKLYHSLGTDAIELSFKTPNQLFDYHLSEQAIKNIKKFKFISIHAPWKEIIYGDSDSNTQKILEKLKLFCDNLNIKGIVLHPDIIENFEKIEESGLHFLLENMDKNKSYGTHPNQFRELKKKFNFGFVLDVKHAYEHDSSMKLAREFIGVMGDRLKHMHVSGCNESGIHTPTYCSANKEAITKILKMNLNVPKILEGILLEDIPNSIKKELEYIGNYERN